MFLNYFNCIIIPYKHVLKLNLYFFIIWLYTKCLHASFSNVFSCKQTVNRHLSISILFNEIASVNNSFRVVASFVYWYHIICLFDHSFSRPEWHSGKIFKVPRGVLPLFLSPDIIYNILRKKAYELLQSCITGMLFSELCAYRAGEGENRVDSFELYGKESGHV